MAGPWLSVLSALCIWGQQLTHYQIDEDRIRFWKGNLENTDEPSPSLELSSVYSQTSSVSVATRVSRQSISDDSNVGSCQGLIGIFCTMGVSYAGIIVDSTASDDIGPGVRRVKEIALIRVPGQTETASSIKAATRANRDDPDFLSTNEEEINLMKDAFAQHSFYFSAQPSLFDVTRNTQSNALHRNNNTNAVESCDSRFFWNNDIASSIVAAGAAEFITPICNIWSDTIAIDVAGSQHNFTLVSRRSRFRQGPRFLKRGIDINGSVANFVETEQILRTASGLTCSFSQVIICIVICVFLSPSIHSPEGFDQVRGSLPTFWSQHKRSWLMKPKVKLLTPPEHPTLLKSAGWHFRELHEKYCCHGTGSPNENTGCGGVAVVNLLDKSGVQFTMGQDLSTLLGRLGQREGNHGRADNRQFREEMTEENYAMNIEGHTAKTKYLWYDYHYNTDHYGIQKANTLYAPLRDYIAGGARLGFNLPRNVPRGNFFCCDKDGAVLRVQTGVIRTNCIDCLDRTNVVQSLFSKWVLARQLSAIGRNATMNRPRKHSIFARSPPSEEFIGEKNMCAFRKLWADHGDALSMLYAGTKALKRDITRFGKRKGSGILGDGITIMRRFVNSNFKDIDRQNGIDIMLGKYARKSARSESHDGVDAIAGLDAGE